MDFAEGQACSNGKCQPLQSPVIQCPDSGTATTECECTNEICTAGDICGDDGFCGKEEDTPTMKTIVYFALAHEDVSNTARIIEDLCPQPEAQKACPNIQINIDSVEETH